MILNESTITPEQHLDAIKRFLDETTHITLTQTRLLELMRPLLATDTQAVCEHKISYEVGENILAVGRYVTALAEKGIQVCARNRAGRQHPLAGLAYQPWDLCYSAGIETPTGTMMWPLDGNHSLVIRSAPAGS